MRKEPFLVSVCMITYNHEQYIAQAIKGVLMQKHVFDIELIIGEDCSTDRTPQICKEYKEKYPDIINLRLEKKNIGMMRNFMATFKSCTGKYIALCEGDDYWSDPYKLQKQVDFLEKNEEYALVHTNFRILYAGSGMYEDMSDRIINTGYIFNDLLRDNQIGTLTVVAKKEILINAASKGLLDKGFLMGDYPLWLEIAYRHKIGYINEVTAIYRVLSESAFNTNDPNKKFELQRSIFSVKRYFSEYYKCNVIVEDQLLPFYKNLLFVGFEKHRYEYAKEAFSFIRKYQNPSIKINDLLFLLGSLNLLLYYFAFLLLTIKNLLSRLKSKSYRFGYFFINPRIKFKQAVRERREWHNLRRQINFKGNKTKINLLFFIPWMVVGGADKVILDIISKLDKSVFSIHIITTQREVHVWDHKFNQFADNIWHLPEMAEQIFHWDLIKYFIKSLKINVIIISNSIDGYQYLPLIKKEFQSIKTIDLLHGQGGKNENGGFPRISSKFDKYLNKRIVINKYLREYIIVNYGIESNKISVIYNGIDRIYFNPDNVERNLFKNKFGLKQNDIIISFIGRLNEEKHPEHLIELARLFDENGDNNYYYFIAGDGIKRNEIGQLIEKWDLKNHVFMLGVLDDVRPLLKDTDVLLVCSEMEGLPIVVLEAMSMGVPVVASNVGGLPEMIDNGRNGILVDYDSNFILNSKNAIVEILDKKKVVAQNNIKKIETIFSLEQMITKYENVILGN